MNKGLEVIETRWLFDVKAEKIEVLIHPQSIVHSMVEFGDGSIMAQLGATDMRIPISYALAYPHRIPSGTNPLDLTGISSLSFDKPDVTKFPLLKAAYDALSGDENVCPLILNAADEVAVDMFLKGKIAFNLIPRICLDALDSIQCRRLESLEDIELFHDEVRRVVGSKWDKPS
ncbi:MAG: 1-deoxy-D-xylulose-5-phosphate reductoisomerase, partial [Pseudomonadota bacterium]